MNSFYSEDELEKIGFAVYGKNILVSRKCSIYNANKIILGNNIRIDDFCILSGKIILHDFIHISAYTALYGGTDGIEINSFSSLSSRVSVYSMTDDFTGQGLFSPLLPDEYRNVTSSTVYIDKYVLVGSTSIILPGITLAEGSSFGAFSLIKYNSVPWTINVGIPTKIIKTRSQNLLELETKFKEELIQKNKIK